MKSENEKNIFKILDKFQNSLNRMTKVKNEIIKKIYCNKNKVWNSLNKNNKKKQRFLMSD